MHKTIKVSVRDKTVRVVDAAEEAEVRIVNACNVLVTTTSLLDSGLITIDEAMKQLSSAIRMLSPLYKQWKETGVCPVTGLRTNGW